MSNLIGIASISAGDITADNLDAKASATLSVGANAATTTLNLGTNGSTQAINMGTGSGVKTITIGGGTDDTVTINGNLTVAGTTISVNSSNATILDKIITLNKNGAAASGGLVGLEIEEAGSSAGAYLRTNATRDAWVAKAPNGSEVTIGGTSSQFQTNSGSNIYLPSGSNLAIGKSSAIAALDVVGNINFTGNLMANGSNLAAAASYQISYVFNSPNDTTGPAFIGATGTTSVLKFTDTYNNASTALNTANMTFTAPVSGIYMVSAYNIENKSASAPATILVSVNGSTADSTYTINIENDSVGNASTASYPISLSAGNTVQFYVSSGAVFGSTGAGGIASKGRYSIALMNQNASLSIGQATGMGVPNQVVFTSGSSTWSVPSGVTSIQVEMVGGGGSGSSGYSGEPYAGGGGAGGGYIRAMCSVSSGQSFSYTIGTGGTSVTGNTNGVDGNSTSFVASTGTSILNLVSPGGEKGYFTGTTTGARQGRGGYASTSYTASGTALTSAMFVSGGDGFGGNGSAALTTNGTNGGNGGGSYFGGGGAGGMESNSNNQGVNAKVYGSGGGGGRANAASGTGAPGVIIITYFTQSGLPTNYTATAPLSMSGTTLSIAAATTSAAGVVQVGSGLSVSGGVISNAYTVSTPLSLIGNNLSLSSDVPTNIIIKQLWNTSVAADGNAAPSGLSFSLTSPTKQGTLTGNAYIYSGSTSVITLTNTTTSTSYTFSATTSMSYYPQYAGCPVIWNHIVQALPIGNYTSTLTTTGALRGSATITVLLTLFC
jgi:hypothetical protein